MDVKSANHDRVTVGRRAVVGSALGISVLALPAANVSASTVQSSGTTVAPGDDFDVQLTSVTTNTSGQATLEFN